ncbi:MAG: peptide-methionine (S)-S-oxide reductase MsrA [Bacillota bacterium]
MKEAIFGAGCFWGVEKKFYELEGVLETEVGYAGGNVDNPSYEEVCKDDTGHVEVVRLKYDEKKITYNELLDFFFDIHNPTTLNRQGPDVGKQYNSTIIVFNDTQRKLAKHKIEEINSSNKYLQPLVTNVWDYDKYFKAEEYHQKYNFKK